MDLTGLILALAALLEQLAYALGLASHDGVKKRSKANVLRPAGKS